MGVFALIKEDLSVAFDRDPAIKSKWELLFSYPGVWAVMWHRLAHWLYKKNFKILARFVAGITQFFCMVDIHPAAKIGRRLFIDHAMGVVIGESAIVGDDVTIYQQVTLGGVELNQGKRHPTVEDGVVIGAGAKVLGNIIIGKNAKIGANSVVVRDVAEGCTAVGIPARSISAEDDKKFQHHKLPDIEKEMFLYIAKRLKAIEGSLVSCKEVEFSEKDREIDKLFEELIKNAKER